MKYKVKEDFLYYKKRDIIDDTNLPESVYPEHVKIWLTEGRIEPEGKVKENKEEELSLDLNGDGIVDSKDASIAGKVMAKARYSKKASKKKKD